MRNIATIPARDREALFRNTDAKMGMSEAIIEKDFWVCYMLDYLFHRCTWKDNLAFKSDLLTRVVDFKDKFYRCPWARYDLAKRGTMRLMPPDYNLDKLRTDYEHMQNMLFGERPSFEEIMGGIEKLETEVNNF
jgi:hypothetical protein